MNAITDTGILPIWDDPVHAAQAGFRCLLKALAEPGTIHTFTSVFAVPAPLDAATAISLLTLADFETPLWLSESDNTPELQSWLRFHCGCPLTADTGKAKFAVITEPRKGVPLQKFSQGSQEYPDHSTTLLIQVPSLDKGPARTLSGPGINGARLMHVAALPADFDRIWQQNYDAFPLGVDVIFCCNDAILGLPRTTRIQSEAAECM